MGNTYTFTYQKTLLHALLLHAFKIVRSLQCILKILKIFVLTFLAMWKKGLIGKLRLILDLMTSQTGKQIITNTNCPTSQEGKAIRQ